MTHRFTTITRTLIGALVGVVLGVGSAMAGPTLPPNYSFRTVPGIAAAQVISSRGNFGGSKGNGTDPTTCFRVNYYAPHATANISAVWSNTVLTSAGLESNGNTPFTFTAAIEYPSGTRTPLLFRGQSSATFNVFGTISSDQLGLDLPAGANFGVLTCVQQSGSTVWPLNYLSVGGQTPADGLGAAITAATNATPIVIATTGTHNLTTGNTVEVVGVTGNTNANGTWVVTVVDTTHFSLNGSVGNGTASLSNSRFYGSDLTPNGSANMFGTTGGLIYGPVAVTGAIPSGVSPVWASIIGDSIAAGTGDTASYSPGYIVRGLGGMPTPAIPFVNCALTGTTLQEFASASAFGTQSQVRRVTCLGAPYVVLELGTNDINTQTAAQMEANYIAVATSAQTRGARVILTTMLPKTTSTDSWATAGNQTVTSGEAVRVAVNDWERCGAPIIAGAAVACGTSGGILSGSPGNPIWLVADAASKNEVNSSNVPTIDGGRILTNGTANYPTTDGTHPTSALAAIIAQAIPLVQMVSFNIQ